MPRILTKSFLSYAFVWRNISLMELLLKKQNLFSFVTARSTWICSRGFSICPLLKWNMVCSFYYWYLGYTPNFQYVGCKCEAVSTSCEKHYTIVNVKLLQGFQSFFSDKLLFSLPKTWQNVSWKHLNAKCDYTAVPELKQSVRCLCRGRQRK